MFAAVKNCFSRLYNASRLNERRCLFCGIPFVPEKNLKESADAWFCPSCRHSFGKYAGPVCPACGHPVSVRGQLCSRCSLEKPMWKRCVCHGIYRGAFRSLILSFKFERQLCLRSFFSEALLELMCGMPQCDVIVPTPSSAGRLRNRGYNQTCILARSVGQLSGIAVDDSCLLRTRDTLPQARLGRSEREISPRDSFTANGRAAGKRVLLIDDVLTTGATARCASQALYEAGAAEVYLAVLARAVRNFSS